MSNCILRVINTWEIEKLMLKNKESDVRIFKDEFSIMRNSESQPPLKFNQEIFFQGNWVHASRLPVGLGYH